MIKGLIQNLCHYTSTVGGTQVLYVIPSAVEDHYFFYLEGNKHGFRFRIAKLLGESHCYLVSRAPAIPTFSL
ncbi:hypothetical protein A6R68_14513 [Neotoma lepida]|uniref:Uncharacterized protein n=1 Tax=Neotoma lepida TaxID=56216 RepID=A0A1A6H8N7_NEOLE|nr:hypothetical protein A6R68_14513 [Neotoma lepida]